MGKRWKFAYIFVLFLGLCGCGKKQIVAPAVVTQVQIDCVHAGTQYSRNYTDSEEISAVLNCLRLQRSQGTAQVDPERLMGDVFVIRIGMSDGTQHIYRHRGGQYLSKDSKPWQIVSREYSGQLYSFIWEDKKGRV